MTAQGWVAMLQADEEEEEEEEAGYPQRLVMELWSAR